jgi:hypothetical protein
MIPIKSTKTEQFVGLGIKLWFKSGKTVRLGDGLFISDGINAHIWIGKRTKDEKSISMMDDNVKEAKVKSLIKATYRNMNTGNFETVLF